MIKKKAAVRIVSKSVNWPIEKAEYPRKAEIRGIRNNIENL